MKMRGNAFERVVRFDGDFHRTLFCPVGARKFAEPFARGRVVVLRQDGRDTVGREIGAEQKAVFGFYERTQLRQNFIRGKIWDDAEKGEDAISARVLLEKLRQIFRHREVENQRHRTRNGRGSRKR